MLPLTNIAIAAIQPDRAASALSLVNVSWGIGAVIWPMAVRSFGTAKRGGPDGGTGDRLRDDGYHLPVAVPAALLTVHGASIATALNPAGLTLRAA